MTRFIVIRHGETQWNTQARIQGHRDSTLTAAGRDQAEALAGRMAAEKFDVLISSDLGRAFDTASAVAARCTVPIVKDERLRERSFGAGEGLTYDEIDKVYPNAFSRVREVDPDYTIPGGESRRVFHDRVRNAFDALAREHAGRTVVVVTHGGVLATFYRHVNNIGIEAPHRVAIANASYNALSHDGDSWTVEMWGDTSHLPDAVEFEEN